MKKSDLLRVSLLALLMLNSFAACDKDNPTGPKKDSIADYVVLGVSNGQPSFTFPKESATGYFSSAYTNIQYDIYSRVISFDAKITCPSGNVYDIQVSEIKRNSYGTIQSYKAEITATINGREISGTLSYP